MPDILLVGAGQLGSRHLQSLAYLAGDARIQVVDPSLDALRIAASRYKEIDANQRRHEIEYLTSLEQADATHDVVIVATSADVRRAVVERLLRHCRVRYVVLEKVAFQAREDYEVVLELLQATTTRAWVNCPRRAYDSYRSIKAKVQNARRLFARVTGAAWGLAGGSIHLIDLMAFFTDQIHYTLTRTDLSTQVVSTRRPGFLELTGAIEAKFGGDATLSLECYAAGTMPVLVTIETDDHVYVINESAQRMLALESSNEWRWVETGFKIPYQSELTWQVVESLLATGTCLLPTYHDSMVLQLPLLDRLLSHFGRLGNPQWGVRCPIT